MSAELRRRGRAEKGGKGEGDAAVTTAHAREERERACCSCSKCIWRTAVTVALIAAVIWALPAPVHVDPIAFRFSDHAPRPFEGALEVNTELRHAELLFPGELVQPETFVRDEKGYIYTGLGDGRLACLTFDLSNFTTVLRVGQPPYTDCGSPTAEHHCGRLLGLHRHPTSSDVLYAADSSFGLLKINTRSKQVESLVPRGRVDEEGIPFVNFCNDLVVLANGSIFFTDTSKKFLRADVVLEAYEGRANGQLLHYDPIAKIAHVILSELYLPNGVCLNHNGTALLLAESSRARILRYHLTGALAGTTDVFIDNLPGLPDNVSPNSRGDGYWVAFAVTRTWLMDRLAQLPSLRSLAVKLRLAKLIAHYLPKHTLVIEVDLDGRIVRSLHDKGGRVLQSVSHVMDLGDRLLLGSYEAPHAAVLQLNSHG